MVNLAICYENGDGVEPNLNEAIKLYTKEAELGKVGAMVNLGIIYENETDIDSHPRKAIQLYTTAAGLGNSLRFSEGISRF